MKWLLFAPLCSAFLFFGSVATQDQLLDEFGSGIEAPIKTSQLHSFVTWNIYKGKKSGLYQDLSYLIETNDFVVVQEFLLGTNQQKQMEGFLDFYWGFAKSFKDSGEWTGVATISKHLPYESVPLQSEDTEPFAGTPKMSLVSKYKTDNGRELWIVNIHSLNFDPGHGSFMNQLDDVVDYISQYQGPMIFAGDFNTWSSTRFEYLMEKMSALSMERAPIENPMGIFSQTLDHIFYRGLEDVEPELLHELVSSDHKPLRISFFFRKK